jgi:hypothetical protein
VDQDSVGSLDPDQERNGDVAPIKGTKFKFLRASSGACGRPWVSDKENIAVSYLKILTLLLNFYFFLS